MDPELYDRDETIPETLNAVTKFCELFVCKPSLNEPSVSSVFKFLHVPCRVRVTLNKIKRRYEFVFDVLSEDPDVLKEAELLYYVTIDTGSSVSELDKKLVKLNGKVTDLFSVKSFRIDDLTKYVSAGAKVISILIEFRHGPGNQNQEHLDVERQVHEVPLETLGSPPVKRARIDNSSPLPADNNARLDKEENQGIMQWLPFFRYLQ